MGRRFDKNLIEQIQKANDIVSVISENVPLHKKGNTYWGCCPFHNEKTPSFAVTPSKGLFHCFGCKAGGNVFSYVQKYDNISFPEAVIKLAERAGIDLPEEEKSPSQIAYEEKLDQMREVNRLAAEFYHHQLMNTPEGKMALAYLKGRGLREETIKEFKLGYAPTSWDKLTQALRGRQFSDDILMMAGLSRRSKDRVYDYFRNRVMFPICDGRGSVIAFGGRVMDDSQPKYLNSSETVIFNKGKLLFAFDKAYKSIREKKQAILVEGYMDVIALHNKGIKNVVASLGTAFTPFQSQILMRQVEEIILAYDMDGAGRQAARRAMDILGQTDLKVRVLQMPDGKDPDEFIKRHGVKEFDQLVVEALTPFDFLLNEALLAHDRDTLDGKMAVLKDIFPFVAKEKQEIKRQGYLKAIALPLYLEYAVIIKQFRDFERTGKVESAQPAMASQRVMKSTIEDHIIAIALSGENYLLTVLEYIYDDDFTNQIIPRILHKAEKQYVEDGYLDIHRLEGLLDEDEREEMFRTLVIDEDVDENSLMGYIRKVRLEGLQRQYKYHSAKADTLSRTGDPRFVEELRICQKLQDEIKDWSV